MVAFLGKSRHGRTGPGSVYFRQQLCSFWPNGGGRNGVAHGPSAAQPTQPSNRPPESDTEPFLPRIPRQVCRPLPLVIPGLALSRGAKLSRPWSALFLVVLRKHSVCLMVSRCLKFPAPSLVPGEAGSRKGPSRHGQARQTRFRGFPCFRCGQFIHEQDPGFRAALLQRLGRRDATHTGRPRLPQRRPPLPNVPVASTRHSSQTTNDRAQAAKQTSAFARQPPRPLRGWQKDPKASNPLRQRPPSTLTGCGRPTSAANHGVDDELPANPHREQSLSAVWGWKVEGAPARPTTARRLIPATPSGCRIANPPRPTCNLVGALIPSRIELVAAFACR